MFKAVKTVITSNQTQWAALPAFASSFQVFNATLSALEQNAYKQNLSLIGVSAVKEAKRSIVIDKAYAMSSAMVAFAVVNNDVELINHMKISKHVMRNASISKLTILVDRILLRATDLVGQMDDYGVDQPTVDELQALRDELEVQLNAPRNAIVERKTLTSEIKRLRRELDAILKFRLDNLMELLREEHPSFFKSYKNARVVIDQPATHGSGESPEEGESNRGDYGR